MDNLFTAFALTVFAGMATGIGSLIAFTASRTDFRFLSISTGFSAGVMLYVSFVEMFPMALSEMTELKGDETAYLIATIAFFIGIAVIALIDTLIPSEDNPHEIHPEHETAPLHESNTWQELQKHKTRSEQSKTKLMRTGVFTALAIGIHNFPEGLATFISALNEPQLGMAIAIAVALHNIPEGISVSVPIYYATGSRRRAFIYSVLSGLAEPIGAIVAYIGIMIMGGADAIQSPMVMGCTLSGVAGIMVYISLDELIPASQSYGKGHDSIIGLIAGMALMAVSLVLMR